MELHNIPENRMVVINNCLDPFMEKPLHHGKNNSLLQQYGLTINNKILLTVSRMVGTERYKGYDKVLLSLPELLKRFPEIRYMMVGIYDEAEKARLDELINHLGLSSIVTFTGVVPDQVLAEHFQLADIFVMPSEKEGFGIVFIEAMFYGLPVIAGNKDGSVDALLNGEMGILVDPENVTQLAESITKILDNRERYLPDQGKLMNHFGYPQYKARFGEVFGGLVRGTVQS